MADCKHPCLVRGGSPTLSPGKDAGRVCPKALHDAEPTKHTQPFTGERGLGIGIINQKFISKTDFFYKLNAPTVAESVHFAYALINKQDLFFNINYIDIIPI